MKNRRANKKEEADLCKKPLARRITADSAGSEPAQAVQQRQWALA